MLRRKLKKQIEDLMRKYDKEEIDGPTYLEKMQELTSSYKEKIDKKKHKKNK